MNTQTSNIVIYKAIFGSYDKKPKPILYKFTKNIKFILITDSDISCNGWEVIKLKKGNPILNNRHCKMFPWKYFEADVSLYLDGHIEFGDDFYIFFNQLIESNYDFAVNKHRSGGKVADELIRCIDNKKIGKAQLASVLNSNLILDKPSVECGMIFRNHKNNLIKKHADKWWWYFNNVCPRDQLSVQTAANDVSINLSILDSDFSNKNYFKIVGHKNWFFKVIKARFKNAFKVFLKGTFIDE